MVYVEKERSSSNEDLSRKYYLATKLAYQYCSIALIFQIIHVEVDFYGSTIFNMDPSSDETVRKILAIPACTRFHMLFRLTRLAVVSFRSSSTLNLTQLTFL
jgi:hypothetical protein